MIFNGLHLVLCLSCLLVGFIAGYLLRRYDDIQERKWESLTRQSSLDDLANALAHKYSDAQHAEAMRVNHPKWGDETEEIDR